MRKVLVVFSVTALVILSLGAVGSTSSNDFDSSFESSSVYTVSDNISEVSLVLKDININTKYVDSTDPVTLNIEIKDPETGRKTSSSYDYVISETGQIKLDRTVHLHEFGYDEFKSNQQTDLNVEFTIDHPSFEKQVRKNSISLVSNVNKTSCKSIRDTYPGADSGVYEIRPSESKTFEAYCDMNTRGGGWTLYHKTNDSSERLQGVNATPGLVNVNSCDLTYNLCNTDITDPDIQYDELMAFHPETGGYFHMSNFDVGKFETEIADTDGEVSRDSDAQTAVGTTNVVCNAKQGSGKIQTTVDPMIVEVHHFGWDPAGSVNHLWDGPSRRAGSGDENDPAIGNRGKIIVCGDRVRLGDAYLMYR